MPRKKQSNYEKCKNYLTKITNRCGGIVVESATTESTYFEIGGRRIRFSTHSVLHESKSSGVISILMPSNLSDQFILQCHGNGRVSVVNYKKLQEIIRAFSEFPMIASKSVMNGYNPETAVEPPETDGLSILGIPVSKFNDGQLKLIKGISRKVAIENNFKYKF